jgi:hypothetical protein
MLLAYLVALILGGGILVVQLFSGADHAVDAGHDFDTHHPMQGPGLLSTRAVIFGLMAFGLVGAALSALHLAPPAVAFALALVAGAAGGLVAGLTLQTLGHPDVAGGGHFDDARGQTARVLVACAREQRGKIRVPLKGHLVDMIATTDAEHIPAGVSVRVVDVRDEIAHVVPDPEAPR